MKNRSKALLLALCALMLVVTTVFTTLAYLTDTKTVTNTFTVGKVSITLTESATNINGEVTGGTITAGKTATKGNTYKLIPNKTYTKDPTITVVEGSEKAFVYVKVENGIAAIEAEGATTIAAQMAANGWTQLKVDGAPVTNVYVKDEAVDASAAARELPVFSSVKIAGNANVSAYTDAEITITAYAIQAEGFAADAAAAWKAAVANNDITA